MSWFNADSLFEPIEITLGGKDYTVTKITQGVLEQLSKTADSEEENTSTVLDRQLAIILGRPAEEFTDLDARPKSAAMRYLTKTLIDQLSGEAPGNAPSSGQGASG